MIQLGDAALSALSGGDKSQDARFIADICRDVCLRRAAMLAISDDYANDRIGKARDRLFQHIDACESPIEKRLLPALVFANYGDGFFTFPAEMHFPKVDDAPPKGDIVVIPQFAFIRYRFDFGIIAEAETQRKIVAVECDGEEWHKDAMKDHRRDAYLAGFGIDMFRFRGKDIQADPLALASKVAMHLANWRASL